MPTIAAALTASLDLKEVSLVDVEIVRFLGTCEARGDTLLNCSPYIHDWIGKERDSLRAAGQGLFVFRSYPFGRASQPRGHARRRVAPIPHQLSIMCQDGTLSKF